MPRASVRPGDSFGILPANNGSSMSHLGCLSIDKQQAVGPYQPQREARSTGSRKALVCAQSPKNCTGMPPRPGRLKAHETAPAKKFPGLKRGWKKSGQSREAQQVVTCVRDAPIRDIALLLVRNHIHTRVRGRQESKPLGTSSELDLWTLLTN